MQQANTRGGQFNCQRQAVQAHTDLRDRTGIRSGQEKVRLHGLGTLEKERHRSLLCEGLLVGKLRQVGQGQGRNRKQVLAIQAQNSAAGDKQLETRAGGKKLREQRRRRHNLFHIV